MKTIATKKETFEEFEKLRNDLRFKHKVRKTQDELLNIIVKFFKLNNKKYKFE